MIPDSLLHEAASLLDACRERRVKLAIAESCTGGLIAGVLTAIGGSSDVLERGFVAYSNAAKIELLGVPADLIAAAGAISEPVAQGMAEGALRHSDADIAISVTGIAGPGGGSLEKPVGLVLFGLAQRERTVCSKRRVFTGDRNAIRVAAIGYAFALIRARL